MYDNWLYIRTTKIIAYKQSLNTPDLLKVPHPYQ
jgi:hypothetical protein